MNKHQAKLCTIKQPPRLSIWTFESSEDLSEVVSASDYEKLQIKLERAEAKAAVWSGKFCKEEQAAGNGPCGACRYCLPRLMKEAQKALDQATRALNLSTETFVCTEAFLTGQIAGLEQRIQDQLNATTELILVARAIITTYDNDYPEMTEELRKALKKLEDFND